MSLLIKCKGGIEMKKNGIVKMLGTVTMLTLLTVTAFTACKPDFPIDLPNSEASEQEYEEVQSESVPEESETVVEAEILVPKMSLKNVSLFDYEGMMYARGNYGLFVTDELMQGPLKDSLESWNKTQTESMEAEFESVKSCARADYADNPEYFFGAYEISSDLYLKRVDSKVLSVEEDYYFFSGGIHGSSTYGGYTWDVKTGKRLALEDVITDVSRIPALLAEKLSYKYQDITIFADSPQQVFEEYLNPESMLEFTWTLEHDGIVFYFGHYEIGSYADGLQQLKILYAEAPELFQERYLPEDTSNYVTHFNPSDGVDLDVDGDNITENACVICYGTAEGDACDYYSVMFEGNMLDYESYFYSADTYLVKRNGAYYIYVETHHDNDHRNFTVYSLNAGTVEQVTSWEGHLHDFTNTEEFAIRTVADVLGTHTIESICAIGEDGCPIYLEEDYKVGGGSVITKKELEVTLIDEEGNAVGTTTCPVGTELFFDRTDCATYMTFRMEDERRCILSVTPGWPPTVNGFPAEECFEELLYAG